MSINNRDDYDKLAKILYPSIEASGNVYFGQTRKLTMDEILGKNNLSFESHIESVRVDNPSSDYGFEYESYFVWKLGPLYGSVKFDPMTIYIPSAYKGTTFYDADRIIIINEYTDEDNFYYINTSDSYIYDNLGLTTPSINVTNIYGTIFAKYKITFNNVSYTEIINSGEYAAYAKDVHADFMDLCVTNHANPLNSNDRNIGNRHFYIDEVDGDFYLYIQMFGNEQPLYYNIPWDENFRDPLTITAVGDSISIKLNSIGSIYDPNYAIYRSSTGSWETYEVTYDSQEIQLSVGEYVKFKGDCSGYDENNYINFVISGNGFARASGDIRSIKNHDTAMPFDFCNLFLNCDILISAPKTPTTVLSAGLYKQTFAGCTYLIYPANLGYLNLLPTDSDCFYGTYYGCAYIRKAPIINIQKLDTTSSGFTDMFNGCSSLSNVEVYLYDSSRDTYELYTHFAGFMSNVSSTGSFKTNADIDNFNQEIPEDWEKTHIPYINNNKMLFVSYENDVINDNDTLEYKQDKLVTSGTNTDYDSKSIDVGGRGDITSKTTVFDMLDLNPMNSEEIKFCTYNKYTGGFNQEIWGYKCFNNPVMFRNGLYGECASLTTAPSNEKPNVFLSQSYDVTNFICSELRCSGDIVKSNNTEYNIYSSPALGEFHPKSVVATAHANNIVDPYAEYETGSYMSQATVASLLCDDDESITLTSLYEGTSEAPSHSAVIKTISSAENIYSQYGSLTKDQNIYLICKDDSNKASISLSANSNTSSVEISADEINIIPNNCGDLGSDNKKFSNLYVTDIAGRIPTPACEALSEAPDIPIGTILLIAITPTSKLGINPYTYDAFKYSKIPITFKANADSTLQLEGSSNTYLYSINDSQFIEYPRYEIIQLHKGDTVAFKCQLYTGIPGKISIFGDVSVFGNLHSMLSNTFTNLTDISSYPNYLFSEMFLNCTGITDAHGLVLPATAIPEHCYSHMFSGCTNLKKAPMTGLATKSYSHYKMFYGCTSLDTVCRVCTINASYRCYEEMFSGCTSLKAPPEINIGSLANGCCARMFEGCTSLKVAPILCAPSLAQNCYEEMFSGCTNLKVIKCLAETTSYSTNQDWLNNVSATGNVIYSTNASVDVLSALPVPAGWSTSTVSNNKFSNNIILPGSLIKAGYILLGNNKTTDYPTDYEIQNYLGTLDKVGFINIARIIAGSNGSDISMETIALDAQYDCVFKLISGFSCTESNAVYALAMRVE